MVYVGIDLHRKRSHMAVVEEDGSARLSRRLVNDRDVFRELVGELGADASFALEATYGGSSWPSCSRTSAASCISPTRCAPRRRVRAREDGRRRCAHAGLLRADLLPEAYIAPRELRDLLRQRVVLTHMRSALKNRVHALTARQGVQRQHADLFGTGGRRFLDALALRPDPRKRLDTLLRLIGDFDREIDAFAREIDARANHDSRVDVLCQIHGIGRYLGMLIVAEIGEIDRFPSAHLCAWGRPDPDRPQLRQQGATRSHLRPGLQGAALGAGRGLPKGRPGRRTAPRRLERIAKRRGRKIAKVAIARKILTLCFYGLRDGEIRCLKPPGRASALKVMAPS